MKVFFRFTFLSGIGWLCDFVTFALLLKFINVPSFIANCVSSYVGVTFVWFAALKMVFMRKSEGSNIFLLIFWGFQFISIVAYSYLLQKVAGSVLVEVLPLQASSYPNIAAKIIVTPFTLVTNFLFMKFLTRFIRQEYSPHVV